MTFADRSQSRPVSGFNSPLECGLRSVVLLAQAFPRKMDIQRLVHYDYLLVHSGDVTGGPSSIHPPTPHRSGELLVRRPLIEVGVKLMMSKSVIECEFSASGVLYVAGEWSVVFLNSLKTEYAQSLKERAKWVVKHFETYKDDDLRTFMRRNWSLWGAEFEFESFVRKEDT